MIHIRLKKLLDDRKTSAYWLAKQLGMSKQAMSLKLLGKRQVTIEELNKIRLLFNLSNDDFVRYFFSDE